MRVLFVSSSKRWDTISPVIENQGRALENEGIHIEYFTINTKNRYSIKEYFKSCFILRKYINKNKYDIIHAHYFYNGIVSTFAVNKPVVLSLMGSDVHGSRLNRIIIKLFYSDLWDKIIVKSNNLKNLLKLKNIRVIPNGVDLSLFKLMERCKARSVVNFDNKIYILFVGDPKNPNKNFNLAKRAVGLISNKNTVLKVINGVDNSILPYYYNAADILLFTSKNEGSPNVIKEAMACNLPIISTDTGDVKERISEVKNSYICDFDAYEMYSKINLVLSNQSRSNGRDVILKQKLDSKSTSKQIIELYKQTINDR